MKDMICPTCKKINKTHELLQSSSDRLKLHIKPCDHCGEIMGYGFEMRGYDTVRDTRNQSISMVEKCEEK